MKSQLLALVMITGLLFSAGSIYLSHAVFADDPWSDIAARQQAAEQKAMAKYMSYYQFANMDQSKRDWSGLTSTSTDETSRGRNIDAQAQVSLQNAIAQFDTIHVTQLVNLQSNYHGLNDTSTDTQGRDRNAMIDAARSASLAQAQDIVGQLVKIQENYANFQAGPTTDSASTYDRQTQITKNMDDAETQAAALVSQLAKIDQVYVDLSQYVDPAQFTYKPNTVTNEQTHPGRNLTPQEAYALEKAVMIFNQIHERHLALLQSNYYGLTSTSTDENGADRNALIAQAKQTSMDNALRVYNSYYNGAGIK